MIEQLESKRILLKPINNEDLSILYKWRNRSDFMNLCSIRRKKANNIQLFSQELDTDFARDRHLQMIIYSKKNIRLA